MPITNPTSLAPRIRQLAPIAIILATTTLALQAYLQATDSPFVSDDVSQIRNNARLAALPAAELWRLFTEPYNSADEFLPLRDLSYWVDLKLFGLNATTFHLHNIILYVLALPLLYAVTAGMWRYFRPQHETSTAWVAASVTALFALHPALVEPVVWITGRKYVLPNLFALLALWLALRVRRGTSFSPAYASATLLAMIAVMFAKASYVGMAPVIALLWGLFWLDIPRQDRRRSLLYWPTAVLLLAAALLFVFISGSFQPQPAHLGTETIPRALAVLGWLLRLALTPESRHWFYPVADPYLPGMIVLGGVALALSLAAAASLLRKRSLEGFAAVTFLLLCLPNLQIIPYGAPSLVQDRFLALAIWPVIFLIVASAWRLSPAPRTILLLCLALPWGWQTMERPRDWRNFETIIDKDLAAFPGYYMPVAYKIVGYQLPKAAYAEARNTARSITVPEYRAIMLKLIDATEAVNTANDNPGNALAVLQTLGPSLEHAPAEADWNSPVQVYWDKCRSGLFRLWATLAGKFPNDASVRYSAGLWMSDAGYYSNAAVHFRAAIDSGHLAPELLGSAYKNLGMTLLGSGHAAEAEVPLNIALSMPHADRQAECLLAGVYKLTNRPEKAAQAEAACPKH